MNDSFRRPIPPAELRFFEPPDNYNYCTTSAFIATSWHSGRSERSELRFNFLGVQSSKTDEKLSEQSKLIHIKSEIDENRKKMVRWRS